MSWQIRNSAATITYNNENKRERDKLFDFIRNVLVGMIDSLRIALRIAASGAESFSTVSDPRRPTPSRCQRLPKVRRKRRRFHLFIKLFED